MSSSSSVLQRIRDLVVLMTPVEVQMIQIYLKGNLNEVPPRWQSMLRELDRASDDDDDDVDIPGLIDDEGNDRARARNVYEVRDLAQTLSGPEVTALYYYLQGDLRLDPARLIGKTVDGVTLEDLAVQVWAQGEHVRTLKKAGGDNGLAIKEAIGTLLSLKRTLDRALSE